MAGPVEPGSTKSVTLCAGTLVEKPCAATLTSARRLIAFAEVNCQTCAAVPAAKLARFTVTGVDPDNTLEMTITVSAPSELR